MTFSLLLSNPLQLGATGAGTPYGHLHSYLKRQASQGRMDYEFLSGMQKVQELYGGRNPPPEGLEMGSLSDMLLAYDEDLNCDVFLGCGCASLAQMKSIRVRNYLGMAGLIRVPRDGRDLWLDAIERRALTETKLITSWFSCLPPEEEVITDDGPMPIAEIQAGKGVRVLSKRGFSVVKHVASGWHTGPLIALKVPCMYRPIRLTPEHPVLVKSGPVPYGKPEWKPARDIHVGDLVALPNKFLSGRKRTHMGFELNPRLLRLMGYWIAEGWVGSNEKRSKLHPRRHSKPRAVWFAFHAQETEYHEDVVRIARGLKIPYRVYPPKRNGVKIYLGSQKLAVMLSETFGKGAHIKRIPQWMFSLKDELAINFLNGSWRGDGCYHRKRHWGVYGTVSKNLAYQMKLLLMKLGVVASIYAPSTSGAWTVRTTGFETDKLLALFGRSGRELKHHQRKSYMYGGRLFTKVSDRKIEDYNGLVYNLETQDGTFATPGMLVHNSHYRNAIEILYREYAKVGADNPFPIDPFLMWRDAKEHEMSDLLIVPSQACAETYEQDPLCKGKTRVVNFGVDSERFHPPSPEERTQDQYRVLFTGGNWIRKGLPYLIRAWNALKLKDGILTTVGCQVPPVQTHRTANLNFVPDDELPKVYRKNQVFILPTFEEGSALANYEAAASGCAIITTREAGAPLEDGKECIIIPSGDITAIAGALLRLYENPGERERLGQAARAKAETLSWDRFGEGILRVCEEATPK